jgi:hypothetical protein
VIFRRIKCLSLSFQASRRLSVSIAMAEVDRALLYANLVAAEEAPQRST